MDAFTKRAWSKGAQDPAKPAIGAAKKATTGTRRIIAAATKARNPKAMPMREPYPFAGTYALP